MASKRTDAYGSAHFRGKRTTAHRAVYIELIGDPGAVDLHHKCRNRKCVNPEHLQPISRQRHIFETFRPLSYSTSDMLDKLSIEIVKAVVFEADNAAALLNLRTDLRTYLPHGFHLPLIEAVIKLAVANSTIAHYEWQIRNGELLSDEEVGLRARTIRNLNKLRIEFKNEIALFSGESKENKAFKALPGISKMEVAPTPSGPRLMRDVLSFR